MSSASSRMRDVAHLYAYNEEDILGRALEHLIANGVEVIVTDNWSTDGTPRVINYYTEWDWGVKSLRWPAEPASTVSWREMLRRVELIAQAEANGCGEPLIFVHQDADEFRRSSVDEETYADALRRLARVGFTTFHHALWTYKHGVLDLRASEFDQKIGQVKAWVQVPGVTVDLASSGGHVVKFDGARMSAPGALVIEHHPFRTPEQEAKKLARMSRWSLEERAMGWHAQYGRAL